MSEFGLDVPITIDKPRGPIVMSLPEYLAGLVCAIRIPSGDLAELSRSDLIALWSQQSGAAHEDWALDQRLATIFTGGLFVGGQPVEARALCGICRTVLFVARGFLAKIAELRSGARDPGRRSKLNALLEQSTMIHLPEIWDCIRARLPRGQWVALDVIYGLVEAHLALDREDFEPQAPGSDVPKWKRNVRNVLQYRKKTGDIEWDDAGSYRL